MDIQSVPIAQIETALYNPRVDLQPGDALYKRLKKSMDEFGCVEPLVWNRRSGRLVGGHQRLKVLFDAGATHAQVSVVNLPDDKEKALNLALNKITGDWDPRKLAELLDELVQLPDLDLEMTGFDAPEAEALIAALEFSDGDEEKDETFDLEAELAAQRPVVTKPGDLIELGPHLLLCGDSTDPQDVRKVMPGRRAILMATDPPYLVDYDGTNHPGKKSQSIRQLKRKNKDWSATYGVTWDEAAANPELYERFIAAAAQEALVENAAFYCFHASKRQAMVEAAFEKHGFFVHQQIVWVKDKPVLTRSHYGWQHEPCFYGWKRGKKPPRRSKEYLSTVWQIPSSRAGEMSEHPTVKPLGAFEIPLKQHTLPGEVVYEPFCGSGTQLIAAQKLGRVCRAIEISPRYCDVIVRRWLAFVGPERAPRALLRSYGGPDPTAPPAPPVPPAPVAASTRARSRKERNDAA